MSSETLHLEVPPEARGARVDVWLARTLEGRSRSRVQSLLSAGHVRVDEVAVSKNHKLQGGELIEVAEPPVHATALVAQDLRLEVLHEDADVIVVNKAPGRVVHPAPGHPDGTLVNALLYHCADLKPIDGQVRPGIVHRLDKGTSGVIIVAKHDAALQSLAEQFKARSVRKRYSAIVWGQPDPSKGRIETLIGRSKVDRKKMSTEPRHGREAVSNYIIAEALGDVSLLDVSIETGRTHQIRVHMAHIGYPIVGDAIYGRQSGRPELPVSVSRQLLHARELTVTHPGTGEPLHVEAPLPPDMLAVINALRPA